MVALDTVILGISRVLPEPHAGLLAGMVFGVTQGIDPSVKNAMRITGTLHLTALSGMNITILTAIFFSTFLMALPRRISGILTIGVISFFVWFVGPSPSIIRAAIMGSITLLTTLTGYASIAIVSWGIACISMILIHPLWVTDVSFQLSASAALGMILFGPKEFETPHRNILQFLYQNMKKEIATTLSAQVFTLPIILMTFGQISLISPVTNMFIGWTVPIITVLGILIAIFGLCVPIFATILGWFAWVFLEYLIIVVEWTAKIPFASIGK